MTTDGTDAPAAAPVNVTGLPARAPRANLETKPFWDAAAQHRFVLPKCDSCAEWIWYPRNVCPSCGHRGVTWHEVSGRGEVYSFSVVRQGQGPYAAVAPYVLAYVELAEGVRVQTNIGGCPPDEVRVGMPVRVVWDDAPDGGGSLYRFFPA